MTLTVERNGPVTTIVRSRTAARNAMDPASAEALTAALLAFDADPGLTSIRGYVDDSGEGRWTVEESIRTAVPAPVIALSLMMRQRSRQDDSYAAKVNAALRQQFGGHAVQKA